MLACSLQIFYEARTSLDVNEYHSLATVDNSYSTFDRLCCHVCDNVLSLSIHNRIALVFLSCSAAVIFLISYIIMCVSLLFEYDICVEYQFLCFSAFVTLV
jgi:hypothetical protein